MHSVEVPENQYLKYNPRASAFQEVNQMPTVNADKCTACGACADVCPSDAITVGDIAVIDYDKCVECGACVDECPTNAMTD
jgi:ferredoxin